MGTAGEGERMCAGLRVSELSLACSVFLQKIFFSYSYVQPLCPRRRPTMSAMSHSGCQNWEMPGARAPARVLAGGRRRVRLQRAGAAGASSYSIVAHVYAYAGVGVGAEGQPPRHSAIHVLKDTP
jgi:hypothetical protein